MKRVLIFAGMMTLFLIFLCGSFTSAADGPSIRVSGPDGEVMVVNTAIDSLISEYGIPVRIDAQSAAGVPLWRILRLADKNKTLGPGDIIEITGDSEQKIPFQSAYKNNAYLLVVTDEGPYLYVSPDTKYSSIKKVKSIDTSSTDDWVLTLISQGKKKEVTRDIWKNLANMSRKEKADNQNRVFSGIPIYTLFESQGITPTQESKLIVTGQDGYSVEIPWADVTGNAGYLLSDKVDNKNLPKFLEISSEYGNTPAWPLMLIDPEFPGNNSVGNVVEFKVLN